MVRKFTGFLSNTIRGKDPHSIELIVREECFLCESTLTDSDMYQKYKVCHTCRFHYSMTARERVESLADLGTFKESNRWLTSIDPLSFKTRTSYKKSLFDDQARTGLTEAVITGSCTIDGLSCILIALDFGFMGGSMGSVVGEKISLAFENAAKRKIPVITIITSGGSRIQEGILSLMQMAKTVLASNQLQQKGIPHISVLANPSTGQAYASFANMADIIISEPGAIVGVNPIRSISGDDQKETESTHTSESHLSHGTLDAVTDRTKLKGVISVLLDLFNKEFTIKRTSSGQITYPTAQPTEAWHSVQIARHNSRPTSMDYMARIMDNFVELHGDRVYGDDPSIVCGLGQIGGQTVVVIGQQRDQTLDSTDEGSNARTMPEGFRKAQRALRIAEKFELPVITLVDTPGANLSSEAEERGLGHAIASTLALISSLTVPTISTIIGEGGSSGALALGIADRVIMLENAIYSAVSPEEAAELIYQDEEKAEEVVGSLRLTARDCMEMEIVDQVVPEPSQGAHRDHHEASRLLKRALLQNLADLQTVSKRKRLNARTKKFRNMGEYSSRLKSTITREVNTLRGTILKRTKEISDN
ncbi:MAG: acetyl-CoA carboxylase carboxyl transferase subunit beta [SAR202 cluster bacterium]|jgi:acetyl-CoA carboxylase carboxyl transferase alpha subunit/acetyl-CoA carboxylase carboxyl transferase beta subunit|nr:MAG: acetyl-CoA carboxylase carboxyl transferase subunit beta [SAR202 cluster bacterium]MQG75500.1 acetyl-CoA carboxylase carboxyl transferase subunit beta [SAR202 cluster bacterium]